MCFPRPCLFWGYLEHVYRCPRQVQSGDFKRNVSRLNVFRGTNETLLRLARALISKTVNSYPKNSDISAVQGSMLLRTVWDLCFQFLFLYVLSQLNYKRYQIRNV